MLRKSNKGYGLVELVLVIVILGVVSLGILLFMKPVTDLWFYQNFQESVAAEARMAMSRMVREINQVNGGSDIITMTASNFRFRDVGGSDIAYTLAGTTVTRNTVALMKSATLLQFQYFDGQNNTTTTATAVRRIQVTLQAARAGRTLNMSSQISPRNLQT